MRKAQKKHVYIIRPICVSGIPIFYALDKKISLSIAPLSCSSYPMLSSAHYSSLYYVQIRVTRHHDLRGGSRGVYTRDPTTRNICSSALQRASTSDKSEITQYLQGLAFFSAAAEALRVFSARVSIDSLHQGD